MIILYFCLGCQFLAHSVFYTTHFVYFSMLFNLIHHHSKCFLHVFCSVWNRKQFERNILYMQLVSKIKDLILAVFSDHISCVINVGDCISCCRLELEFLYHEKHSLTYVLSVEYVKLSPYNFCQHWCKYLQTDCSNISYIVERYKSFGYTTGISVSPWS